jgi:N-ethylmaleimide reductase
MHLFQPITIGGLPLRNRILMAPMTRCRSDNAEAVPTSLHAEYYRQRASAGLIITEGTFVSPGGVGFMNVPGIYSAGQVEAWKQVSDAVHAAGGTIVMQLWHVGRLSHPDLLGGDLPVSASAVNPGVQILTPSGRKDTVTPRELTADDIARTVEDFRRGAANAMRAGFDGVELHSSNGYLFHQFFSTCSNRRTDRYGGSPENRARFLFEVLEAVRAEVPAERVGVRLNPMLHGVSGIEVDADTAPTFDRIVTGLAPLGLGYLHLTRPRKVLEEEWFVKDVVGRYRGMYTGTLVANMMYDRETAEAEIAAGRADAVSFARLFISNPDLPERLAAGAPLAPSDPSTYYTTGPKGYTDYPPMG